MTTKITVPELGESVVEATVARWLKQEGDRVAVGEAVVEMETEKANFELAAEKSGVLVRIERKAGEDVRVGDVLGIIEESTEEVKKTPTKAKEALGIEGTHAVSEKPIPIDAKKRVTPVARNIAQEHDIDLDQVSGSGPSEQVTKHDVETYLERQNSTRDISEPQLKEITKKSENLEEHFPQKQKTEQAVVPEAPTPLTDRLKLEERVRMSRRRRTIARHMLEAQQMAAILSTFNEVDMTSVMELRKRRKESFKQRHGVGLGLGSFFVKAAIGALRDFPMLNAEIQGDEMVLKRYYDIGVAIGASEGLVVPVLRDADRMSFAEIEKTIKEYAEKAESGNLSLEDLRGGTFTITNGGVFGSLLSTPILNPPQVGILGLHKIEERPVVINHEIVVRPMMYLALSYDHRIVDGREAVQFLVRVKELVEDSETLLLEG
jgi:2-oxoglutarate dehydrogenase E2 component (dihydrolipoamide succinyltransferase)